MKNGVPVKLILISESNNIKKATLELEQVKIKISKIWKELHENAKLRISRVYKPKRGIDNLTDTSNDSETKSLAQDSNDGTKNIAHRTKNLTQDFNDGAKNIAKDSNDGNYKSCTSFQW